MTSHERSAPATAETAHDSLPPGTEPEKSYGQILKSSALIGGSSVVTIAIGIIRTKVIAMLLGPAGFGVAGLYTSITDLAHGIAGLGVNSSGVRQIAQATGSNHAERIALTVAILRRTSLVLGTLGCSAVFALSHNLSQLTFGNDKHARAIQLLSIGVLLKLVSGGQTALIQGMRRMGDLAKMNILGAASGLITAVVLVAWLGEAGIAPLLVSVAGMACLTSWWYSRSVRVHPPPLSSSVIRQEVAELLKLGFAFMVSSLMTLGVAYATRVTVLHYAGVQATGLYQSAWTIGGLYVGFILQAMAADFYPRLTASSGDDAHCNRLVNEQARIGLLLACPGVLATLAFAPGLVGILYSGRFAGSVPILRWICLGAILQVITWPMGYIIVAKGRHNVFMACEAVWAAASFALSFFCVRRLGVTGAGIAFFLSYVFHALLIYPIVRHLSGFTWHRDNLRTGVLFAAVTAVVFGSFYVLPMPLAVALGGIAALLATVHAARILATIVPADELPGSIRRLLAVARLSSSRSPAFQ